MGSLRVENINVNGVSPNTIQELVVVEATHDFEKRAFAILYVTGGYLDD